MAHPSRIFETPEKLLEAWDGYKLSLTIESEKWQKVQYVGKDGERRVDNMKVPLTIEGFKRYCRNYHGEVEQYFTNQDGYYADFIGICRAIREEIREDQITGGLLGVYNPSITQRLNGLADKVETTKTKYIVTKKNAD
jgi:hypothetical protein